MDRDHIDRHGFSLRYADGWAVLVVPPKDRRTRAVYADDVAARMNILGIPPVPAKTIRRILEESEGRPVRLAEWSDGASLGAKVELEISEDQMEASVKIVPPKPGGEPLSEKRFLKFLAKAGIRKGIDRHKVKHIVGGQIDAESDSVVIARGKPAISGKPARTEYLFITKRGIPWKEMGGGRIDLRELNFIQNKKSGDLLARVIPAVEAVDGYDVFDNEIPAETIEDEVLAKAGDGVIETEEGLVAERDGNVRLENGYILVEKSVRVKNVDYSTGNIDFDGSVEVEESIADGFSVKASGDIQIGKTVGRTNLTAGRNIVLVAGIVGDSEGSVRSGHNTYARFLEGAKIEVAGDLVVTEAILHSEIEVDGDVILNEGRGEITGGYAVIGGGLDCKRIGNTYAGDTRIWMGCPPKSMASFHELGTELKKLREEVDEMERQLDYLKSKNADSVEIERLDKGIGVRHRRLKEGGVRLKEARDAVVAADGTTVIARDRIFSGVNLCFGLEEFSIGDKGLETAILKRENGRTIVHGIPPGKNPTL